MVAKQGWKIMTKLKSLLAKIFKVRYFPHLSFFEANFGSNPCYVWRSLWKYCNELELRCRRRIGDECKIKMMDDPWLRGQRHGWVSAS
jgi:hypothetical protein